MPTLEPSRETGPPQPVSTSPGKSRQRPRLIRRSLIGVGVIVILVEAAVLLSGVSQLGGLGGSELNVTKVQVGVQQILTDPASGYGANAVTEVSCNNGRNPSATKGTIFNCAVTVNGAKRQVAVLVSDDAGRYEVDRPR